MKIAVTQGFTAFCGVILLLRLTSDFAMTINKSQGQSLKNVEIYLPSPVFSHGQFYVAISRVTSKDRLKIPITDEDGDNTTTTSNVVYHEVFGNV